ncbi:GNAT family N-acetyltransferase [Saccharopolyspora phatthalungensis]|uniref:GNAT superfamily N-acetyltransferase n=1 Tax=Saccharopolyspora phatthalungensis TaxID=664693 RepID=A0A840QGQ4_9PSEU|nr:GNAT family N-acetyltransferase [Saccharopolyspora phatthalungensis]MBB5157938.1 GNAT superfamily N-acetyltransferase [Saccharopolyspora phatthalungensis]
MSTEDLRVRTLLRAFGDDAFARWLMPDRAHRHQVYREWFTMVLAHTETAGRVISSRDGLAVQVWLSARTGPPSMLADADTQRLYDLAGPRAHRFREFGALSAQRHPHEPHEYLSMIGVDPAVQGTGVGTRELRESLRKWDAEGVPCYLEASSARSRNLYLRLGFGDLGGPMLLSGDGPTLYPMWRTPGQSSAVRSFD